MIHLPRTTGPLEVREDISDNHGSSPRPDDDGSAVKRCYKLNLGPVYRAPRRRLSFSFYSEEDDNDNDNEDHLTPRQIAINTAGIFRGVSVRETTSRNSKSNSNSILVERSNRKRSRTENAPSKKQKRTELAAVGAVRPHRSTQAARIEAASALIESGTSPKTTTRAASKNHHHSKKKKINNNNNHNHKTKIESIVEIGGCDSLLQLYEYCSSGRTTTTATTATATTTTQETTYTTSSRDDFSPPRMLSREQKQDRQDQYRRRQTEENYPRQEREREQQQFHDRVYHHQQQRHDYHEQQGHDYNEFEYHDHRYNYDYHYGYDYSHTYHQQQCHDYPDYRYYDYRYQQPQAQQQPRPQTWLEDNNRHPIQTMAPTMPSLTNSNSNGNGNSNRSLVAAPAMPPPVPVSPC